MKAHQASYRYTIIVARQEQTDLFLESFIVSRSEHVVAAPLIGQRPKALESSDLEGAFQRELIFNSSLQFSLLSFGIEFLTEARLERVLVSSCDHVSISIKRRN